MLLLLVILFAILAAGSGFLGFLFLAGTVAILFRRLFGLFMLAFIVFLVLNLI